MLPAPGPKTNVPHMHEGKETLSVFLGESENISSFGNSPFLQLLALLLGRREDHGQVWPIHFKKDAVLRARDVGEGGRVLKLLVLIICEAFLWAQPQENSFTQQPGWLHHMPLQHPLPKGITEHLSERYSTMSRIRTSNLLLR